MTAVYSYQVQLAALCERSRRCLLLAARPSARWCRCADLNTAAAAAMSATCDGAGPGVHDGLLLFYNQYSFYSQKVVMALHEKKLSFESKIIDLFHDEQYQSWFLSLNPKGEVPVLQDTGKIIPDSARILDYLEDNFSNGDTPRLLPMDQGVEMRNLVNHFRHMIKDAPMGLLTKGAMLHPQLLRNAKLPFILPIRKAFANSAKVNGDKLRKYAEKNPEIKNELLEKADNSDKNYVDLLDGNKFQTILDQIDDIMDKVEEQLKMQSLKEKEEWWLCSDRFTIADVELTIFLERIRQLGLKHLYWSEGKRLNVEKYYARVKQRDSYKKTIPGTLFFLKTIFISQAPIIIGVVAAVALVVGGALIAKKYVL